MLDLYKVVAERETGVWRVVPVATCQQVSRDEWMSLMNDDPDRFQLATLTAEELSRYSMADEDVIERAVVVTWSDAVLVGAPLPIYDRAMSSAVKALMIVDGLRQVGREFSAA